MVESKNSTKEKAAAARAAAEAEQRKRDRRSGSSAGSVIAVLVLGIIGVGVWGSRQGSNDAASSLPTGSWPTPRCPPASTAPAATTRGAFRTTRPPGKPTLAIWEDFQCPACAAFEAQYGASHREARRRRHGQPRLPPDHVPRRATSRRAPTRCPRRAPRAAYGCAIDAGKAEGRSSTTPSSPTSPRPRATAGPTQQLIAVRQGRRHHGRRAHDVRDVRQRRDLPAMGHQLLPDVQRPANVPGTPAAVPQRQGGPDQRLRRPRRYIAANS